MHEMNLLCVKCSILFIKCSYLLRVIEYIRPPQFKLLLTTSRSSESSLNRLSNTSYIHTLNGSKNNVVGSYKERLTAHILVGE